MARTPKMPDVAPSFRAALLAWYGHNRRDLPWRRTRDPYAIWVSEIMLQQTRVAAVERRYVEFVERFPSVVSLARAPEQDVLTLWSGLGYYRRARMLHKAAQFVAEHLNGNLPATRDELLKLPGIGSYTAAAIASIAHGEAVAVVDGNVERVLCRVSGWDAGGPNPERSLRKKVEALAGRMLDPASPGDFNQAMMELGATVCTPRGPQCLVCPVSAYCMTRGEHKTAARPRMTSRDIGHALSVQEDMVLLEQRHPGNTVMPGLWELPILREAAVPEEDVRMAVRHAIMNVNYYVRVRSVFADDLATMTVDAGTRRWVPLDELPYMPLTGLARKILIRARLLPGSSRTPALTA